MTKPILVIEHEATAGPGLIAERICHRGLDMVVWRPEAGRRVPGGVDGYSGLVVLGGSMGPTDDDAAPWLPATRALIRDCVQHDAPLLAVCLGAQLTTTALGGVVEELHAPEVGTGNIRLTEDGTSDLLLGAIPVRAPTLHWHWLHVARVPDQAVVLASSDATAVQAFRVGEYAWGLQFHVEAVASTARTWAGQMVNELDAIGLDPARVATEWEAGAHCAREVWSDVIDRWLALTLTLA